ncbi:MAG: CesT family type III secretion system chaperone [Chlamydiales bacterium]
MIGPFEELLQSLSATFGLDLQIDKNNACSLLIHARLIVQMQLDVSQDNLWIFSKLAETPPGKFRENILKEALKANALPDPRIGILAYLAATNELVLYQKFPLAILNGERLSGFLGAFMEMAESWREAILSGQSAPPNPVGLK